MRKADYRRGPYEKSEWRHAIEISVISAEDLLIENVEMSFTEGNLPGAGIDFEPSYPDERLVRCVLRNCVIHSNAGPGISVSGSPLALLLYGDQSTGVDIPFNGTRLQGIQVVPPGHRVTIRGN